MPDMMQPKLRNILLIQMYVSFGPILILTKLKYPEQAQGHRRFATASAANNANFSIFLNIKGNFLQN